MALKNPSQSPSKIDLLLLHLRSEQQPIGNKWKTLNQFINNVTTEGCNVDDILSQISPTDLFARRIKLMLANAFKRPNFVIETLKSEEKLLVNVAVKFAWMYDGKNSMLSDSHYLLGQLFPNVSYSCRCKIINNLGKYLKDEQLAEK